MRTLAVLRALGPMDLKSIRRDALLRGMVIVAAALGLLLRFAVPPLTVQLRHVFSLDLVPYYGLLMSYFLVFFPVLFGTVIGFLLLDQRDDQTLTALRVTPLSLGQYLAYRVTVPMLVSVAATLVIVPLAGLVQMDPGAVLIAALGAAPLAPLMALFLAAFAQNKIQGFALQKASGVLLAPPIFAYFAPPHWQLAFGVLPTYWPFKLWWTLDAGGPHAWLILLIGLAYQAGLLWFLLRRFQRALGSR